MTTTWRNNCLASRHRALGSKLEDWNGMGIPWMYDTELYPQDMYEQHKAVRTAAGLFDVSGLKKIHVAGPDAMDVLNHVCTRELGKVYPGKSAYASILNDDGLMTDDCIMFRMGPNSWMMVHGSGTGHEELARSAVYKNVSILFDDDLHDISLQGPKSVEFLAQHVPGIRDLRYFHHMQTTLFGRPVMISRTGYSGERGYEIFAKAADIGVIWDEIVARGAGQGIIPCCFTVLDMLRVESYLIFYPYDNSPEGDSLWELGLDFTVSKGKTAYRGAARHQALKGKERIKIFGVLADTDGPLDAGDEIFADNRKVGVVTCGMYSKLTHKSMALARLEPSYARQGAKLDVRGKNNTCPAIAHAIPFDDPDKKKRSVVG
ncbi:MAG: aminomethyltransferase [Alphaproteobacteria bacterium]|nr:MAG: aminomethyltransferase [Alphaproteobacteria bacterium]